MRCPGGGTAAGEAATRRPGYHRRGHRAHGVEIDVGGDEIGDGVEHRAEPRQLGGLDEAEMALRQGQRLAARQRAENLEAGGGDGIGGEAAVALARHAVEHHAADPHARVQRGAAGGDGGGGLRLAADVEHQQHRQAEPGGEVGGGAGLASGSDHAVEQAHRPFADQQVGAGRRAPRQHADEVRRHRPGVEVEAVAAGGGCVEGGVNVVRPVLAGRNRDAGAGEGAQQAQRHHGLAAARARRGDDQAGPEGGGAFEIANGCENRSSAGSALRSSGSTR